ncbi:MAG TPA: substrate-binding domain-containing protein [Gemmatimonadales bacterium]|jgi:ABC-type phosphate transport system substrate-binding protein|nr:substrate-binding domain-containing protein [Gemmatimonadales bacterium]
MLRRLRPLILTGLCLSLPALLPAQEVSYRIVVNATNPVARLTRDQVSKIFLRRINQWDNHQPVLPVDQAADSPVRRAFTKEIHGRTVASIQTWWQQQTFAGIGVAPPERASDIDVLDYVRRYPNAIGYVRAGVMVGGDLKIIDVTP